MIKAKQVKFSKVLDAIESRDHPIRYLREGETIEGILVGAGWVATSIMVYLEADEGVVLLNGHKALISFLDRFPIGATVAITLTSKKRLPYRYTVERC